MLALSPQERVMILAPIVRGRKGEYKKELEKLARQGFVRARIDGVLRSLDEEITLDRRKNHTIEVVVDRLLIKPEIEKRLEASIVTATKLADGLVLVAVVNGAERLYSQKLACPDCGASVPQLEPRSFSFNSPFGACETCTGLGSRWSFDPVKVIVDPSRPLLDGGHRAGRRFELHDAQPGLSGRRASCKIDLDKPFDELAQEGAEHSAGRRGWQARGPRNPRTRCIGDEIASEAYREWFMQYMSPATCPDCEGQRLKPSSLAVRVNGVTIAELTGMSLTRRSKPSGLEARPAREQQIGGRAVEEIRNRLEFLVGVGLEYLSLERSAATLSGGEAQRIRLATQIGSKLRGVLYVLDEPSIGLHPRDNDRLLDSLARFAIWATRCWWWSTMPKPSSAPIT